MHCCIVCRVSSKLPHSIFSDALDKHHRFDCPALGAVADHAMVPKWLLLDRKTMMLCCWAFCHRNAAVIQSACAYSEVHCLCMSLRPNSARQSDRERKSTTPSNTLSHKALAAPILPYPAAHPVGVPMLLTETALPAAKAAR